MKRALCTDLDRTLTDAALVLHPDVPAKLAKLRASGVIAVLVTGRALDHLLAHGYPEHFDALVAENGAVLHVPSTGATEIVDPGFATRAKTALGADGDRVAWGRVIGSAPRRMAPEIERALLAGGVAHALIPNADEVMLLPPGVDKATGARLALGALGAADARVWAIGDGENDVVMLEWAHVGAAPKNGHPAVQEVADVRLEAAHAEGFLRFADEIIEGPEDSRRRAPPSMP